MPKYITKTDYILYRDCAKDAWFKIHRQELYFSKELSQFALAIIETGNKVELVARKLFPDGVLIKGREGESQALTLEHIKEKTPIIFQAVFSKDGFLAATDILQWDNESNAWILSEVKSTNSRKDKEHLPDLAFQANLLKKCGVDISRISLIHLNSEYVRSGDLDLSQLFVIEDVTEQVFKMLDEISNDMDNAIKYLSSTTEPPGNCSCIYRGRSAHCTMFPEINPTVPEYSVHDLVRIGSSKKKLTELVDNDVYLLDKIADDFKLNEKQLNQISSYKSGTPIIETAKIKEELEKLQWPLYFLDYETYPCAIPKFDGFSSYQQIPFQYSLHILDNPEAEPEHKEFLYVGTDDPSSHLVDSLKNHIGNAGSIIVWYKPFECGRNKELGERLPGVKAFMDDLNNRVYDLMDIFAKQMYVDSRFIGSTSIKKVLPVIVPELSYEKLEIKEGGTASQEWNKIVSGEGTQEEKNAIADNLKTYCKMDTYAMYAIWKHLFDISDL